MAVKQATPDPVAGTGDHRGPLGSRYTRATTTSQLPFLRARRLRPASASASHRRGRASSSLRDLVTAGKIDEAHARNAQLAPLLDALSVTVNPIPIKTALALLGHRVGGLRLPLIEASAAERVAIQAALSAFGLTARADATATR